MKTMAPPDATRIYGNWEEGWALDYHTVSSHFVEDRGYYDTVRTPIGDMLYRLKYQRQWWLSRKLAKTAVEFLKAQTMLSEIDCIVTIPPKRLRLFFQPVRSLAKWIGRYANLPVEKRLIRRVKRLPEMKALDDTRRRALLTRNMFSVRSRRLAGKNVLLFDDLYRSGMTLREGTRALKEQAGVSRVFVLTITRTRVRR